MAERRQSQRSAELEAELTAARERLADAERRYRDARAELEALEARGDRVEALRALVDSLERLRHSGGECPLFGGPIDAARYERITAAARPEIEDHDQRLPETRRTVAEAESEWRGAAAEIADAEGRLEKQRRRDRAAEREERRRALAERARQLTDSGAQRLREMSVEWTGTGEDDNRLKRVAALVFLLVLGLSILMPMIELPPPASPDDEEMKERLAELVVEREPPEPEPQEQEPVEQEPVDEAPEEEQTEEEPPEQPEEEPEPEQQVAEPEPREEAPETQTAAEAEAREKASQSGLLAMSDELEEMASNSVEEKLGSNADVSTQGSEAQEASRDIVTAEASAEGSGGIDTDSMSRNVGGSGGSVGSRETSRVESAMAEQAAQGQRDARRADGQKGRTDEEIQIVFDRNKSALYRIYNRALRQDPTLQGKVTLKLTIEPSGRVSMVEVVDSELGEPVVARKIAQRVRLFDFGEKDVAPVTITYPIDFLPA